MPRKSDFIDGRFIDVNDVVDAVHALEKALIKCQNENRRLREKCGLPVSSFRYR